MTADEFLALAHDFQLGALDTERPHPATRGLSRLAQTDVAAGVAMLRDADLMALAEMEKHAAGLPALSEAVARTLASGGRIFLCGCGATGRLSLSVELFCREGLLPKAMSERVVAFMAGGDLALIRAVEKFEDHPEYGARQLDELGFGPDDLLIASTEGGETPWVIGATERAAEIAREAPYFLYCNPEQLLSTTVERSRRILTHPKVQGLNLAVGPMALSGSTRMQASTVLMAAIVYAIAHRDTPARAADEVHAFHERLAAFDMSWLAAFTAREAAIAQRGEFVFYEPGPFGITVLTDTTERSPTFSLVPFENQNQPKEPASWCHLFMPKWTDATLAWRGLLHREPRTVEWPEIRKSTGRAVLMGYDFSSQLATRRRARTKGALHHVFRIGGGPGALSFHLDELHYSVRFPVSHGAQGMADTHLMLKLILNTHSTLLMGSCGRFEDNVMTYVKSANNKLIDRAIRYIRHLREGQDPATVPSYEATCRALFATMETLVPGEPVVLKTLQRLAAS
jgi:N-acetylmuramic acid 6-phosphate etherase